MHSQEYTPLLPRNHEIGGPTPANLLHLAPAESSPAFMSPPLQHPPSTDTAMPLQEAVLPSLPDDGGLVRAFD